MPPKSPRMFRKALNYGGHLRRRIAAALKGQENLLPPQAVQERLDICAGCPTLIGGVRECAGCGCPVDEKAKYVTEHCWDWKWPGDKLRNDYPGETPE